MLAAHKLPLFFLMQLVFVYAFYAGKRYMRSMNVPAIIKSVPHVEGLLASKNLF